MSARQATEDMMSTDFGQPHDLAGAIGVPENQFNQIFRMGTLTVSTF